jgi:hypothetical protein
MLVEAGPPWGENQRLLLCRFLGRRRDETHHALVRPASEKRQGTKSREVGQRRCSELRDLAAPCDPKISVQIIIIILCDRLVA